MIHSAAWREGVGRGVVQGSWVEVPSQARRHVRTQRSYYAGEHTLLAPSQRLEHVPRTSYTVLGTYVHMWCYVPVLLWPQPDHLSRYTGYTG